MEQPFYHITLVAPEIPQNTGNIGRICCCTECRLHLVEPVSFSLEDKYVRRAGMDYWKHVDYRRHADWEALLETAAGAPLYFFSTKAEKLYWDCPMEPGAFLVFGSEGHGLPPEFHQRYADRFYTIPDQLIRFPFPVIRGEHPYRFRDSSVNPHAFRHRNQLSAESFPLPSGQLLKSQTGLSNTVYSIIYEDRRKIKISIFLSIYQKPHIDIFNKPTIIYKEGKTLFLQT